MELKVYKLFWFTDYFGYFLGSFVLDFGGIYYFVFYFEVLDEIFRYR